MEGQNTAGEDRGTCCTGEVLTLEESDGTRGRGSTLALDRSWQRVDDEREDNHSFYRSLKREILCEPEAGASQALRLFWEVDSEIEVAKCFGRFHGHERLVAAALSVR